MRIIKIEIIVAPDDEAEQGHASRFEFDGQRWTVDGPMFPRIAAALHEIVLLVRGKRS